MVGAGSAGFSAATATEAGARVALIGSGVIGGTCVNLGCVPSKVLIRAVEPLHQARAAQRFNGIHVEARLADWHALVDQKQALVDELRQAQYIDLPPAFDGIDYREGAVRFGEAGRLLVDGEPLTAEKVVIATGARTAEPSIRGIRDVPYLTITTAMELEHLPRSLLVIGAGYVGAELAQVFARAGVAVTVVSRRGLLPAAEPEIRKALTQYLDEEGIRFVSRIAYERIERTAAGVRLTVTQDGEPVELEAETVLAAAGRQPNTEGLGLEAAGIATHDRGAIRVDEHMRTTRPGVHAAGDVAGRDLFVYMAAHGAKQAALNALNGDRHSYDDTAAARAAASDQRRKLNNATQETPPESAENFEHALRRLISARDRAARR